MDYALTAYPLSVAFRTEIEATVGRPPKYLLLSELRQLPVAAMIRKLRAIRGGRVLIPMEDPSSLSLLPVLECVAAVSAAKAIEVIYPGGIRKRVSRRRIVASLAGVIFASIASAVATLAAALELEYLKRKPRTAPRVAAGGSVLYLKTNLWFGVKAGGSVGHIAGVVNALVASGRDVSFVSAEPAVMLRREVRVQPISPPSYYGLPSEWNLYRFQRQLVPQVVQSNERRSYSFVYQRMSVANFAGVTLSRRWQVPLVLEYNGSEAWVARNWGTPLKFHALAVKAEEVCLRHSHLVVTVSEVLREELLERGVEPERIVTYPNCVDLGAFDPERFRPEEKEALRREYGIPADAQVIGFVGTFGQWHGIDVLAEAIGRLVDEEAQWLRHHRVRFMLVGDGLKMSQVRARLTGERYAKFVVFTGLVDQMHAPRYMASCDVLVSPHVRNADGSRFFGSPTKLFEYMAMAKGIVASDLEQIGKVLEKSVRVGDLPEAGPEEDESRLAVLVAPGSVDELVQGMKFMVERPVWRLCLGRNSREAVLAKYTWSHHVKAILDGLERVSC